MKSLLFRNPANGYEVRIDYPALGCLLCGPLYLGIKGAWMPATGYFVLTLFSAGFFWLILPFFAASIFRHYYLGRGWEEKEAPPREEKERSDKGTIDIAITALLIGCVVSGGLLAVMLMV
jgi:formate hydrogenlyase subunit 3/multisubunit Na+/H+ antiporter MnhD subunit